MKKPVLGVRSVLLVEFILLLVAEFLSRCWLQVSALQQTMVSEHRQLELLIGLAAGTAGAALVGACFRLRRYSIASLPHLTGLLAAPGGQLLPIVALTAVAEESLFRGVLQRLWGQWPATIAFVMMHAGFFLTKPFSETKAFFALTLACMSYLFSLLFGAFGIGAAIAAHLAYDFVVLLILKYLSQKMEVKFKGA